MRIRIVGDVESAIVLRQKLSVGGFVVSDRGWDYSVKLEDSRSKEDWILIDGIDSPFEHFVARHISKLTKADVMLRRRQGIVFADNELRICIPDNLSDRNAVELGILRGLLDLTKSRLQVPPKDEIPVRKWWQFWKKAVVATLVLVCIGRAQQQTPTGQVAQKDNIVAVGGTAVTAAGGIPVNIVGGGGSGGTSSSFGAAFPSTGTAIGVKNGANMTNLAADGSSNLLVNCAVGCSGSSFTDNTAFTAGTSTITNIGGVFNDGLSAVASGNAATPRITSDRMLYQNIGKINGVAPLMGNGTTGTGSLRVTIASDNTAFSVNAAVSNFPATQAVTQSTSPWVDNVSQFGGNAVVTGVGVGGSGIPRVTVSSDSAVLSSGTQASPLATWTSATALNTAATPVNNNFGYGTCSFSLVQTTTITGGAVAFETSIDGVAWFTIGAIDAVSGIPVPSNIYSFQANTNKLIQVDETGYSFLRLRLSTAITGTGTVTIASACQSEPSPSLTTVYQSPGNWLTQDSSNMTGTTPGTAPGFTGIVGGIFNSSAPSPSNGQTLPLQLNASGALKVDGSAVTQPISGTVSGTGQFNVTCTAANCPVNTAQFGGSAVVTGTGISGSGIPRVTVSSDSFPSTQAVTQSGAPWSFTGTKTNNNAAPGATNVGVLPCLANASNPSWTEGNQVDCSVDLSGNNRELMNSWFGSTAPTVGSKTSANSIPVVIASDQANVAVSQATASSLNATVVQGNAGSNGQAWWMRIGDTTNGPVSVQPAINTNTSTPPTYSTAGASGANAALVSSLSPSSGLPFIVQKVTTTGTGSQASLQSSSFTETAGNSVIVVCGVGNAGAITVSDTLGHTYTQAVNVANGSTFSTAVFYVTNIKGGSNQVTVTPSASVSIAFETYEIAGIVAPGGSTEQATVDTTASGSGSSTSPASGSGQSILAYEYAFGAIAIGTANQTPTAFAPWLKDADMAIGGSPSGLFGLHAFSMGTGQPASISLSATITSEPWAAAIATFKGYTYSSVGLHAIWDGTNIASVKAASTQAAAADKSLVVQINPNQPQLSTPLNVQGGKTNNAAAPGATNIGAIPAIANAATQAWTEGDQVAESVDLSGRQRVRGTIADNGAAIASDLLGVAPGTYQTSYLNGTAATQGRNAALSVGTDGLLWTATLPSMRPASYVASKKFAASSTTDIAVMPGNASNTVLLTKIRVSCTQTTAGIINVEVIKRSAADTSGTSAAMTAVPDDSNYAAAQSAPLSYTGTGPSVGSAVGDIDNYQLGCLASGTAGANDVYILNRTIKPIVLRGTAQQVALNLGGAVTGGNVTVTYEWIETSTITP